MNQSTFAAPRSRNVGTASAWDTVGVDSLSGAEPQECIDRRREVQWPQKTPYPQWIANLILPPAAQVKKLGGGLEERSNRVKS